MAIADDISVATNGDVRWTGDTVTNYTVLAFHRFLQDLADDAVASGDDLLDITSDTPSERSTDNIISLLGSYNINDEVSEHLYNGSISQSSGDTVYSGLVVVGSVESGTELEIIQDNKVLSPFWGTGINIDAGNNVIMQIMIKTREDGADIDGKRLRVQARELGDTYAEFSLTAGLGNSTAAVFTSADLNNASDEVDIASWTSIVNTEGYQLLDITGDGVAEEYYAQWDTGVQSINDVYERTKWIQKRGLAVDENADTGTDYIVDNATTLGQGQLFTVGANDEKLVRAVFDVKIGAGAPTGNMYAELYATDGGGPDAPTGAALATSELIDVTRATATYSDFIFAFNDNVTMSASTSYFIVIRHAEGTAGAYLEVDGAAAGTHAGNAAVDTGTWAAVAAVDLKFTVYGSPIIHALAGELFRGITHEIVYNNGSGTFQEDEIVVWGTTLTYNTLSGTFTEGEYVTVGDAAGKVLYDNTTTTMVVALEDTSVVISATDAILGLTSGATAVVATVADNNKSGGEGLLLALDDNTGTGDFYIQLLTGSAPVSLLEIRGMTSTATADVNVTVTSRTISPEFVGASTGSNIIGAYGIAFDPNDVSASDQFFDLTNTLRQPPNNVTFSVTGLIPSEDRVLVAHRVAGAINESQLTTNTTLNGAAETEVWATTDIPSDTPAIGTIRVELDNGVYDRIPYTGFDGSGFALSGTVDFSTINSTEPKNLFISYIDDIAPATSGLSYTAVYSTDRALYVRVRDGGATPIKTFESPATFGNANASIAAIRTSDA